MAAMPLAAALPQEPGGEFCATDPGVEALKVHRKMLAGDASVVEKIEAGKANLREAAGLSESPAEARAESSAANGAAMSFNA